jgi:hypothetical protein
MWFMVERDDKKRRRRRSFEGFSLLQCCKREKMNESEARYGMHLFFFKSMVMAMLCACKNIRKQSNKTVWNGAIGVVDFVQFILLLF